MNRPDLLAMTHDDVVALSNRGTLKRVLKELEKPDLQCEISVEPEAIIITWSDGVTCTIGADDSLPNARCTCSSTADICRHLLRSLLAYQEQTGLQNTAENSPAPLIETWDPGALDEAQIEVHFPGGEQRRARRLWNRGLVLGLRRGPRPEVRFHKLGHLLRFVVPNDPASAVCDCTEAAPCVHILLAIWGFQQVEDGEEQALISVGRADDPLPQDVVDAAIDALSTLVVEGISDTTPLLINRLRGIEERLDKAGASWLAAIVAELIEHCRHYREHNARFSAEEVAELLGEFMLRVEVASRKEPPLPRYFLVGNRRIGKSTFGRASLVGLGSVARMRGTGAELLAMAQDIGTGQVVAISRNFEPPDEGLLPPFDELGARSYGSTPDIRTLGKSRIVVERAKLLSDNRLRVGRSLGTYEQDFRWEDLRPPLLVEDFAGLGEELDRLAISTLGPRRLGADFFVCPVSRFEDAQFCDRTQAVRARIVDDRGGLAELYHPYSRCGAAGTQVLLSHLVDTKRTAKFIAGHARRQAAIPLIEPTAIVFEEDSRRYIIQPWVDPIADGQALVEEPHIRRPRQGTALQQALTDHIRVLAEVVLLGREQASIRSVEFVEDLLDKCRRLELPTQQAALTNLRRSLDADAAPKVFAESLLCNAKLARLSQDIPEL